MSTTYKNNYTKQYYKNNKDKIQKQQQQYKQNVCYIDNRKFDTEKKCTKCNKILTLDQFYFDKQRENYCSNCKNCKSQYQKEMREHINISKKERRKENPKLRLKDNLQSRLSTLLSNKKSCSTTLYIYLGCSYDFFIKWVEFQLYDEMTMENYGRMWHIDHVMPCSSFDLDNMKECFNWKNMRPFKKEKNLKKSSKIDKYQIVLQELKAIIFAKPLI